MAGVVQIEILLGTFPVNARVVPIQTYPRKCLKANPSEEKSQTDLVQMSINMIVIDQWETQQNRNSARARDSRLLAPTKYNAT